MPVSVLAQEVTRRALRSNQMGFSGEELPLVANAENNHDIVAGTLVIAFRMPWAAVEALSRHQPK